MSDSEDDFVEVSGYQSSDSDWEKISRGEESEEEGERHFSDDDEELVPAASKDANAWPDELMASYYQSPPPPKRKGEQNNYSPIVPTATQILKPKETRETRSIEAKKKGKKKRAAHLTWDKVSLKRGQGAPYDPVEFLGITGGEKSLLNHLSITTIGQLAYFNAMDFVSSTPEKFAIILDLQERAYEAVTEYVTKASAQPDTVWGYLYLSDKDVREMLRKGFLDSDALYFLWSPMPSVTYRDQLAIDDLVGIEAKDRALRSRYSRFVKINLTKLCSKYYGRLYQRDPINSAGEKWFNLSLLEAAELAQREDLWYAFEPGNEIFSRVAHGSIVIPTGRIPQDCMELDKETCVFANAANSGDSSDDEREEANPTVASKLEYFY